MSISSKFYALLLGEPSSPTGTSYTLKFDLDSISCADSSPYLQPRTNSEETTHIEALSSVDHKYSDISIDNSYLTLEPPNPEVETRQIINDSAEGG